MSVKQGTGYCLVCNRQTLFQKQKINHVLHFFIGLFTLVWWGVWAVLGIINSTKPMRCASCGMPAGSSAPPAGLAVGQGYVYPAQSQQALPPVYEAPSAWPQKDSSPQAAYPQAAQPVPFDPAVDVVIRRPKDLPPPPSGLSGQ